MDAIWTRAAELPRFPPLKRDLQTDVLLIGGGLAGLLCAWRLTREGVNCALLEADRLCGGVTGHTTAKVTAQHGLFCHTLLRRFGPGKARLYWEANQAALERYRALGREIDCEFQERDAYVYHRSRRDLLQREAKACLRLGIPAELVSSLPLPFPTAGAVRLPRQAQVHPLKLLAALSRELPVFEETRVTELLPGQAVTASGNLVTANKVVIATHFPFLNQHGSYFLKLYQHRSYVLALENAPDPGGMYVDGAKTGLSFRTAENRLLLGGGGHRTGKPGGGWAELEALARRWYPQAKIAARWAAQDCMSLDGVPYIGPYSRNTPGLYVATGFSKWGMTSAMAAAELLAALLQGRESPYAPLFSPSRSILRPQLVANGWEAVRSLLTPRGPRCPHMGCALRWNPQEHSWDCPCHGSRFGETGTLLDNPATGDLP